jgi:glycosyltransferase involved in cell wall biosynthesis
MTVNHRVCAIVPSHDHWKVAGAVVARLRAVGLAVFVIDDGSGEPARTVLAGLHDRPGGINVVRLAPNQGKGGAVVAGFRLALAAGFTHAIQVDADGQHDLDALADLLALSDRYPTALVSGQAVYDETVPLNRRIGRWLTHVWVWIETLSLDIADSMCGFRVYPLAAVEALLARHSVGRRMDFDPEIMVRLFLAGTPVVMLPIKVAYPPDNTSNFAMFADNWRITRMHTRLVVAMLLHFPSILLNRPQHLNRAGSSSVSREP